MSTSIVRIAISRKLNWAACAERMGESYAYRNVVIKHFRKWPIEKQNEMIILK
jgi:hypothetical protein